MPVIRLYQRFNVQPRSTIWRSPWWWWRSSRQAFLLVVDELIGKHEVVIKTLGAMFKDLPGVRAGDFGRRPRRPDREHGRHFRELAHA